MEKFDVVIIGSGIGGLVCGGLLGKEGRRICILEKNQQLGGALQTYARDKVVFDSGVHYLGALSPGQNLYQLFTYLGIMDQLHLVKMDDAVFDKILLEGDDKVYALAQGYEGFIRRLSHDFPDEREAIVTYVDKLKDVCSRFPLYNLRSGGDYQEKASVLDMDTEAVIASLTQNPTLRAVLAGNNILYAGQGDKTPFYVHALIVNSFLESAWKCIDGGSQIARALARQIRSGGGLIRTNAEVTRIVEEEGRISHVLLADGTTIEGNDFISNVHPVGTLRLTDSGLIKNAYRNRLAHLENSIASFCVNVVLKEGMIPYETCNYYYHRRDRVWTMATYTPEEWPLGYALFLSPSRIDPAFAGSLTIMTYMKYGDVAPWADTFNTTARVLDRGPSYDAFKEEKVQRLLDCVAEKFPGIRHALKTYYASTPLSFRDYLGTDDGTLYGFVKDYRDAVKTIIPARTKIPNLFLTGQNLNLHGILGSAISSLATCSDLLGRDDFVDNIRNA